LLMESAVAGSDDVTGLSLDERFLLQDQRRVAKEPFVLLTKKKLYY
jgi:hypothetical protein